MAINQRQILKEFNGTSWESELTMCQKKSRPLGIESLVGHALGRSMT